MPRRGGYVEVDYCPKCKWSPLVNPKEQNKIKTLTAKLAESRHEQRSQRRAAESYVRQLAAMGEEVERLRGNREGLRSALGDVEFALNKHKSIHALDGTEMGSNLVGALASAGNALLSARRFDEEECALAAPDSAGKCKTCGGTGYRGASSECGRFAGPCPDCNTEGGG